MAAEQSARLFDLPAGEWTDLVIRRAGVHFDDGGFMVNRRIPCRAVPTDLIEDVAGTPRRLFVRLDPPIEGVDEIWLEDAPLPRPQWQPASGARPGGATGGAAPT